MRFTKSNVMSPWKEPAPLCFRLRMRERGAKDACMIPDALQACWSLLKPTCFDGETAIVGNMINISYICDVHTRSLGSSGSPLTNRCQDWFCLDSFGHARWNLKIIKVQNITDGISTQYIVLALGICLESLGIPDRPVHYYYYLNEQA